MFEHKFMLMAFVNGSIVALICGVMSFFVVIRKAAFTSHSLSHISFTGASGASLLGFSSMLGQMISNSIAAIIIATINKSEKNDTAISVCVSFFMGIGSYFLFLQRSGSPRLIIDILFGNILSTSIKETYILFIMGIVILVVLCFISKMLFFESIDPVLAKSCNISIKNLSMIFLLLLSLTITIACQIVGSLLIFSLLVGPGAISFQWCGSFYKNILFSVIISLATVWSSLTISFYCDLPVSLCITVTICILYMVGVMKDNFYSYG